MDKKRRSSIAVAEYKKSIAIKPNIIDAGIHEQFRDGKWPLKSVQRLYRS